MFIRWFRLSFHRLSRRPLPSVRHYPHQQPRMARVDQAQPDRRRGVSVIIGGRA